MGEWRLEAAKFALYIFAPVFSFYHFHKVENFEQKLKAAHRSQYSIASAKSDEMIKEFQTKMREKRDKRFKEKLVELNNKPLE